eukprot:TRINITY_DN2583_c0_g1_i1.p1 TRINITY_DN2583_c0_g1~~TRINITY_DN2583_c0_g1_i1.p1  ORF type:complete len:969 (+),score=294.92 TRINITY_DN2583_c0_g1_i1:1762-4668(+)
MVENSSRIKVYCRLRPLQEKERLHNNFIIENDEKTVSISEKNKAQTQCFQFDHIFQEKANQSEIFDEMVLPIVDQILNGIHCSILAYGKTSSGKTHSVFGPQSSNADDLGIVPRIMHSLFQHISQSPEDDEFTIKMSFLEIYMEKITDLLSAQANSSDNNLQQKIKIIEHGKVFGAKTIAVSDLNDVYCVLRKGINSRTVGETSQNLRSSRSHAAIICYVTRRCSTSNETYSSRLSVLDLAGSERLTMNELNKMGVTRQESLAINASLSSLSRVLTSLVSSGSSERLTHIPYRDSQLTRLLENSIGGNSLTSILLCGSRSAQSLAETISTFRFGSNALKVKNVIIRNKQLSVDELLQKIAHLEKLVQGKKCFDDKLMINNNISLEEKVSVLEDENCLLKEENMMLKQEYGQKIDVLDTNNEQLRKRLNDLQKMDFNKLKIERDTAFDTISDLKNSLYLTRNELGALSDHVELLSEENELLRISLEELGEAKKFMNVPSMEEDQNEINDKLLEKTCDIEENTTIAENNVNEKTNSSQIDDGDSEYVDVRDVMTQANFITQNLIDKEIEACPTLKEIQIHTETDFEDMNKETDDFSVNTNNNDSKNHIINASISLDSARLTLVESALTETQNRCGRLKGFLDESNLQINKLKSQMSKKELELEKCRANAAHRESVLTKELLNTRNELIKWQENMSISNLNLTQEQFKQLLEKNATLTDAVLKEQLHNKTITQQVNLLKNELKEMTNQKNNFKLQLNQQCEANKMQSHRLKAEIDALRKQQSDLFSAKMAPILRGGGSYSPTNLPPLLMSTDVYSPGPFFKRANKTNTLSSNVKLNPLFTTPNKIATPGIIPTTPPLTNDYLSGSDSEFVTPLTELPKITKRTEMNNSTLIKSPIGSPWIGKLMKTEKVIESAEPPQSKLSNRNNKFKNLKEKSKSKYLTYDCMGINSPFKIFVGKNFENEKKLSIEETDG